MSTINLVDTQPALDALVAELADSAWLAVDTEFMRETTYYPVLCLIQISNGTTAACVDPLALDSLDPLLDLLYRRDIVKVFHAASQDLEILCHLRGAPPGPLFDTQIAATLAGHGEQIGYAPLVSKVLDVSLDKSQTRSDWSRRPLSEQELQYAINDVIYLADLYHALLDDLAARGRSEWLASDFAALEEPSTYLVQPDDAWRRVKGGGRLPSSAQAIVRSLAAWREQLAQSRDTPRKRVLRDDWLIDIARRKPRSRKDLERVRGLPPRLLERHGDALLNAVRDAEQIELDEPPPRRPDSDPAIVDLLMAVLRDCCERAQVTPGSIASRKELEALIGGKRDLPALTGWRHELAGKTLLEVLSGERTVRINQGQLQYD